MTVVDVTLELELQQCTCGGVYAMPKEYIERCRRSKSMAWHCPFCRALWSWGNDSVEGKLQAQLAAAEKARITAEESARNAAWRIDQAEAEAAKSLSAKKRSDAELKRQKIRVHNGVCPCCNRTFTALGTHMTRMHPDYLK